MSRPRHSRSTSRILSGSRAHSRASSIRFLQGGAESLIVPDVSVGSPAVELLDGFVDPRRHESEATSSTRFGDSSEDVGQKHYSNNGEPLGGSEAGAIQEDEEELQEREEMARRPFYKRPSPWWMLGTVLLASIAMTTTLAPRVELYTALACQAMKPEYTVEDSASLQLWVTGKTVPPPAERCGKDPDVQAAVAWLITVMTVSSGILSCLTTGWWGQLSDRYGRTRILGIATIGLLATDFNFILVSRAAHLLPGGYRFILVGPALDGLFGGMSTLTAGLQAYMSDCTPPEERSRIFSLNSGLMFTGMAVGPTLGGLLIHKTNDLMSVFYLATASHVLSGFFIWLVIPESVPKSSMRNARKRRATQHSEDAAISHSMIQQGGFVNRFQARITSFVKTLFGFLAPLSIFIPSKRLEGKGRDWNLTLMVIGFAFYALLMGSYQFKFQYAQSAFGWNSETLGYWISIVGVARATYLVLILPLVIKLFKPKVAPIQLPVSPVEPLDGAQSSSESSSSPSRSLRQPLHRHSARFDLSLARTSLGVELICYVGIILSNSSISWTAATMLAAFGAGFSPALQSVALALYEQGPRKGMETGRLFGGLSVVQSLSAQIIGPSVFGFTYMSTVSVFPKGIFVVAAGMTACALLITSFVRLVRGLPKAGHDREETAAE